MLLWGNKGNIFFSPFFRRHADMKVKDSTYELTIFNKELFHCLYMTDRKKNGYGPPSTAFSMSSLLKA